MDPIDLLLARLIDDLKFHLHQDTTPDPTQLRHYIWRCEKIREEMVQRKDDLDREKLKFK